MRDTANVRLFGSRSLDEVTLFHSIHRTLRNLNLVAKCRSGSLLRSFHRSLNTFDPQTVLFPRHLPFSPLYRTQTSLSSQISYIRTSQLELRRGSCNALMTRGATLMNSRANMNGSIHINEAIDLGSTTLSQPSPKSPKRLQNVGVLSTTPVFNPSFRQDSHEESLRLAQDVPFNVTKLAWAMKNNLPFYKIQEYVEKYPSDAVKQSVNREVLGFPLLYYAVERVCCDCLNLLLSYGAWLERTVNSGIGLLPFVIIHGFQNSVNVLSVVQALLAAGADPNQVPSCLWEKPWEDPVSKIASLSLSWDDAAIMSKALASGLNMALRYFLYRASLLETPKARAKNVAELFGISNILKMPYYFVGRDQATLQITETMFSHLLTKQDSPLVLCFGGPSGHGKTVVAKQLCTLLAAKSISIDCSKLKHESDLFGPQPPYQGHQKGSKLSNHLEECEGERNVVFLDEFEKTTKEVWNSLLVPLDEGICRNNKTGTVMDVKNTIWILATNAFDDKIGCFFTNELQNKTHGECWSAPYDLLQKQLRQISSSTFGQPLTGRISAFIPFFPFQDLEAGAICGLHILELSDKLRKPVNIEMRNLMNHIHLETVDDGKLCKKLASEGYSRDTGARSIHTHMNRAINIPLTLFWLKREDADKPVTEEINQGPLETYTIRLRPDRDNDNQILVAKTGYTLVPRSVP